VGRIWTGEQEARVIRRKGTFEDPEAGQEGQAQPEWRVHVGWQEYRG
jgi:hypothetical protein